MGLCLAPRDSAPLPRSPPTPAPVRGRGWLLWPNPGSDVSREAVPSACASKRLNSEEKQLFPSEALPRVLCSAANTMLDVPSPANSSWKGVLGTLQL